MHVPLILDYTIIHSHPPPPSLTLSLSSFSYAGLQLQTSFWDFGSRSNCDSSHKHCGVCLYSHCMIRTTYLSVSNHVILSKFVLIKINISTTIHSQGSQQLSILANSKDVPLTRGGIVHFLLIDKISISNTSSAFGGMVSRHCQGLY